MELFLPLTDTVRQNVMKRLNIKTKSKGCQWEWKRIASEFSEFLNYEFARGAFSPIDKILEIATSNVRGSTGASIDWDKAEERATGIVDRDANGRETTIFLKKKTNWETLLKIPRSC